MTDLLALPETQAILSVIILFAIAITIELIINQIRSEDDNDSRNGLVRESWWIIPGTVLLMYLTGVYGTPFFL